MTNNQEVYIEGYINQLIQYVNPNRVNVLFEGKNPRLSVYQEWYNGYVPSFHDYDVIFGGKIESVVMAQSNLGAMICQDMASSFANEDTKITIPKETEQDNLDLILKRNNFLGQWNKFVEKYQALGIGATIVTPAFVDAKNKKNNKVKINFVDGTRVYPITRDGEDITEVAIIRYVTNKLIIQVHIQNEDETYTIIEGEGTINTNGVYAFDLRKENVKILKTPVPLFQIWMPNVANSKNDKLGVSRFDLSIPYIKQADMQLDTNFYEFKNGKKKRFISADLTEIGADGQYTLPISAEEFVLPSNVINEQKQIQEFASAFRIEILDALTNSFNLAYQFAGLGDGTFTRGEGGRPLQTATAVIAKESKKGRTILKEENVAIINLTKMLMAIQHINNTYTSNPKMTFNENDIQIVFADNIIEDEQAKKEFDLKLVEKGVLAEWEMRSNWLDEDEETAKAKLKQSGVLALKYAPLVVQGMMTAEQFVDLVYDETIVPDKKKLVAQIELLLSPQTTMSFEDDEADNNNNEEATNQNQDNEDDLDE